jgi:hypothetical protein
MQCRLILHPGIADVYRQKMTSLASVFSMDEEARLKATSVVRSLWTA